MMSKDNPKAMEATHSLDDAFPLNGIESRLETIIEQNEELLELFRKIVNTTTQLTANGAKKK